MSSPASLTPLEAEVWETSASAREAIVRERVGRLVIERDGLASLRRGQRGNRNPELLDGAIAYSEARIATLERELEELAEAAGVIVVGLV